MFKLFALTAGMLQVSQAVSLEHMQEIANLQDVQTELPEWWDRFVGQGDNIVDWAHRQLQTGRHRPRTEDEQYLIDNGDALLAYAIKRRDDTEFRAEEDARKEEEGEDFEPNLDGLSLAQRRARASWRDQWS